MARLVALPRDGHVNDAHMLKYGTTTFLQVRVVLAVGEAEHQSVLAAVFLHVGDHVPHALRHRLALHVALDTQLLDGFLLLRDVRHGSTLVAEGCDTVSVTAGTLGSLPVEDQATLNRSL